jgi:hypothetical protein
MQGLLPSSRDTFITDLFYILVTYHALGKLRIHTEDTLRYWEVICHNLGNAVRIFCDAFCPLFETRETPREAAARARRVAKMSHSGQANSSRRLKIFNVNTYKFHAIADGPATVRWFGTTDSYSTWIVSTSLS